MYKHHQARKHQKADEDLTRILQCIDSGTLSTKEVERLGLAQQDRIHVRQILNLKMEQRVLQKRIKNHRGNESVKLIVSQILRLTGLKFTNDRCRHRGIWGSGEGGGEFGTHLREPLLSL